ncbi:MAG: hypothetical protein WBB28_20135 [Crinalium sp.]
MSYSHSPTSLSKVRSHLHIRYAIAFIPPRIHTVKSVWVDENPRPFMAGWMSKHYLLPNFIRPLR